MASQSARAVQSAWPPNRRARRSCLPTTNIISAKISVCLAPVGHSKWRLANGQLPGCQSIGILSPGGNILRLSLPKLARSIAARQQADISYLGRLNGILVCRLAKLAFGFLATVEGSRPVSARLHRFWLTSLTRFRWQITVSLAPTGRVFALLCQASKQFGGIFDALRSLEIFKRQDES